MGGEGHTARGSIEIWTVKAGERGRREREREEMRLCNKLGPSSAEPYGEKKINPESYWPAGSYFSKGRIESGRD